MSEEKNKRERILLAAVVVISLAGILYFGYRAIRSNSRSAQVNPFEYDIESFKKTDPAWLHFSEVGRIPLELQKVFGLAVGPDDEICVSGDSSLLLFNRDGTARSSIQTENTARCVAFDGNGDLYLGMMDHVEVFDRTGERKVRWESLGEEAILTSIALSEKDVFVADAGHKVVWRFDKTGNRLQRIGEKNEAGDIPGFIIPSPYFDVAVDPDGFLWAANTGRHSLENYMPDGNLRTSWGEFSMDIEGFAGCCNPSHFAFLEDGSFVTSEKGLVRVKVYNRLGNLVSVVAGPESFAEGTVGLDLAVDSSQRILVLDPFQKSVRIFEKKNEDGGVE